MKLKEAKKLAAVLLCAACAGCSSVTPQELELRHAAKQEWSVPRHFEAALKGVVDKWAECENAAGYRKVEIYPGLGEGRVIVFGDWSDTWFLVKARKTGPDSCAASVYAQRNQPKRLEIIRRGLFGEPLCPQR